MINGFIIKEANYHGLLVEYIDDRGVSRVFNLIPPISKDGLPLTEIQLIREIARCAPNLDDYYQQVSSDSTNIKLALEIGKTYSLTQDQIQNWFEIGASANTANT